MNRARILLADDHRGAAELLKSLLAREFDLVAVVEDGLALVEAAKKLKPDVIVADISMPGLDGVGALAEPDPGLTVDRVLDAETGGVELDLKVDGLTREHGDPALAGAQDREVGGAGRS